MSIYVAPGSDLRNTIRPAPCPAREGFRETCEGFLSGGNASHDRLVKSFRNGCYQHIYSLGVAGFVVCNHWDKEILLVDPWPTYASYWTDEIATCHDRTLTDDDAPQKQRISLLASFLRRGVEQGYSLRGILVSHMHFDHSEDVFVLLELLAAPDGVYTDHQGRRFQLEGAPVAVDELPRIACDYDTIVYYMMYHLYVRPESIRIDGNDSFVPPGRTRERSRYWWGNDVQWERSRIQRERYELRSTPTWTRVYRRYCTVPGATPLANEAWQEVTAGTSRLHYDDSYNYNLGDLNRACRAGTECSTFYMGHFKVTPHVWDHMNTGGLSRYYSLQKDDQTAGDLQRISAFQVQYGRIDNAKRTFFVGSAGEMNEQFTAAMTNPIPNIETDLLIQAIVMRRPSALNFRRQTAATWSFVTRHVTPQDAVILIHWEEFCRLVAQPSRYKEDFDEAIPDNLASLGERLSELRSDGLGSRADHYQGLLDNNRFYALVRRNFELAIPSDPEQFRDEENAHHPW